MDALYYVYTLLDNGCIFYVGCSKDVRKRYLEHTSINSNSYETYNYIQQMMLEGRLPTVGIAYCRPKYKAFQKEAEKPNQQHRRYNRRSL